MRTQNRTPAAGAGGGSGNDVQADKLNSPDTTSPQTKQATWRDKYRVHPAADLFPMMDDDELAKLGEDIKANGLHWGSKIVFTMDGQLLDGRNRLEAMERAGVLPDKLDTTDIQWLSSDADPAAFVISANIHRRHLTKQQQADLIVAVHKASRQVGEVPKRHVKGKAGSQKDEFKAAAIAIAAALPNGPSKRMVERALARADGKTPKPKAKPISAEDAILKALDKPFEDPPEPKPVDLVAKAYEIFRKMNKTEHEALERLMREKFDWWFVMLREEQVEAMTAEDRIALVEAAIDAGTETEARAAISHLWAYYPHLFVADGKDMRPAPKAKPEPEPRELPDDYWEIPGGTDSAREHYAAEIIKLGGEKAINAELKVLKAEIQRQWRKRASTLPQDGRSDVECIVNAAPNPRRR